MKLTVRITGVLVLIVLVLIVVAEAITLRHENRQLSEDMRIDGVRLAETISEIVGEIGRNSGQGRALEVVHRIDNLNKSRSVRIVYLDASAGAGDAPLDRSLASRELTRTRSHWLVNASSHDQLCTYSPIFFGDRPAAIELAETTDHATDNMYYVTLHAVVLMGATTLLGALFALIAGSIWVGRPLQQLVRKTRAIGQGDYSAPLQFTRRDEFGELAAAVNEMCGQLNQAHQVVAEQTSARVAAIEQLRHVDRLRTVGHLAAGIAHEIGTPLNVVSGRANLIASGRLAAEETQQSAEVIKDEADRITRIIRQLLDFARRNRPQCQLVDLGQLTSQTIRLLESLADDNGCRILLADNSITDRVPVDPIQIQQVLTNLLVNAVDATVESTELEGNTSEPSVIDVTITQRHAEPPPGVESPAGEYAAIAVRDRGCGISSESLDRLFEPFYTTKDIGQGTGLGLSIAYGIVQEHGGWIEVDSHPSQGTCFTMLLPLTQMDSEALPS